MRDIIQFIQDNKITMTTERTDNNPNMYDNGRNMDHWKCLVKKPGARMTVYFSMGYGHNSRAPELKSVLDCLASDAAGIDNARGNFEEWAAEYGYDTDSRKAEKTFKACERIAKRLENFLGAEEFQALMFDTEKE